jgi:RNA polymerase primary sigma factor
MAGLGRSPTDAELADAVGISLEQLATVRRTARTVTSLDRPIGAEEETTLAELLPSEHAEAAFEELQVSLLGDALRAAVRSLPDLERQVIELRYLTETPLSLTAVARRLGIGADRVKRLETSALAQLALERELQSLRESAPA